MWRTLTSHFLSSNHAACAQRLRTCRFDFLRACAQADTLPCCMRCCCAAATCRTTIAKQQQQHTRWPGTTISSRMRTQLIDISQLGSTQLPINSSLSHCATAKCFKQDHCSSWRGVPPDDELASNALPLPPKWLPQCRRQHRRVTQPHFLGHTHTHRGRPAWTGRRQRLSVIWLTQAMKVSSGRAAQPRCRHLHLLLRGMHEQRSEASPASPKLQHLLQGHPLPG